MTADGQLESDDCVPLPQVYKDGHYAFWSDFDELLKMHLGKWVVYHGAKRIGIHKDDLVLHRKMHDLGVHPQEYFIALLVPGLEKLNVEMPMQEAKASA